MAPIISLKNTPSYGGDSLLKEKVSDSWKKNDTKDVHLIPCYLKIRQETITKENESMIEPPYLTRLSEHENLLTLVN